MVSQKDPSTRHDAGDEVESDKLAAFLFMLETYHVLTHLMVLFGLRMLPRKDLVRQRLYFLFDTATIFSVNFLYLGNLRWLAVIQMIQHFSYIIWWDKADFCRRVISWSSLDWSYTYEHRYDWNLIIGTTFDLMCHLVNSILLCAYISQLHGFIAFAFSVFSLALVVFNPRLAWSTPSHVPSWVRKRVSVLEEDVGIKRIVE